MRITRTLLIGAPASRVWKLISEPDNLPSWLPEIVETRFPHGRSMIKPEGARFVQTLRHGGKPGAEIAGQVKVFNPERQLAVTYRAMTLTIDFVYDLASPEPDQTKLDCICDVKPGIWIFNLCLRERAIGPQVDAKLSRLKAVAEDDSLAL